MGVDFRVGKTYVWRRLHMGFHHCMRQGASSSSIQLRFVAMQNDRGLSECLRSVCASLLAMNSRIVIVAGLADLHGPGSACCAVERLVYEEHTEHERLSRSSVCYCQLDC